MKCCTDLITSKLSLTLLLHVALLCIIARAQSDSEAAVISFEAERNPLPIGQSVSYTCRVRGRAVWQFSEYNFDTSSPLFEGNQSNVNGVEGIDICDTTDASGNHLSKLFLSSSFVASLNITNIMCAATRGHGYVPDDQEIIQVKVFSSPTSPGNVQVSNQREREVTLTWDPSFLPFNITPQYRVFVNGSLKATLDQPSFVFSRTEHTCDPHLVHVEAFNEVGSNTSEQLKVVLPAVPDMGALSESINTHVSKLNSGMVELVVSFEPASSCAAHPVTNYTLTLTSATSDPISQTVPARDNLSITLEDLADNTLYQYQITASNVVGSAVSAMKTLYTTDVSSVTALETREGSLSLSCVFVQGSTALGCEVRLETQAQLDNLTHILHRDQLNATSVETVLNITHLACYQRLIVFDIEADNTIGTLGVPGEIQIIGNRPCTVPSKPTAVCRSGRLSTGNTYRVCISRRILCQGEADSEDSYGITVGVDSFFKRYTPLSEGVIIGISVAVACLLIITVLIIITICCIVSNQRSTKVKDTVVWTNQESYYVQDSPNKHRSLPAGQDLPDNKLPIYDRVYAEPAERQTSPCSSQPSPDYELLRREFGDLRSPPAPPTPEQTDSDTPTYAKLNQEAAKAPDYAEPYEEHVPMYCEPYEVSQTQEHVYQTLEESKVAVKATPTSSPPPAYYSQVADALPSGSKVKSIRSAKLSLPHQRSDSRNSLSQV